MDSSVAPARSSEATPRAWRVRAAALLVDWRVIVVFEPATAGDLPEASTWVLEPNPHALTLLEAVMEPERALAVGLSRVRRDRWLATLRVRQRLFRLARAVGGAPTPASVEFVSRDPRPDDERMLDWISDSDTLAAFWHRAALLARPWPLERFEPPLAVLDDAALAVALAHCGDILFTAGLDSGEGVASADRADRFLLESEARLVAEGASVAKSDHTTDSPTSLLALGRHRTRAAEAKEGAEDADSGLRGSRTRRWAAFATGRLRDGTAHFEARDDEGRGRVVRALDVEVVPSYALGGALRRAALLAARLRARRPRPAERGRRASAKDDALAAAAPARSGDEAAWTPPDTPERGAARASGATGARSGALDATVDLSSESHGVGTAHDALSLADASFAGSVHSDLDVEDERASRWLQRRAEALEAVRALRDPVWHPACAAQSRAEALQAKRDADAHRAVLAQRLVASSERIRSIELLLRRRR